MGSGQVTFYNPIRKYPEQLYHYDISIAGYLKKELEKKYTGVTFKVVNTALYTRTIHQSFLMYVSNLAFLKPDLVIQMDGFNDLSAIVNGNPYTESESDWLKYYTHLYSLSRKPSVSHSINLFYFLLLEEEQKFEPVKYTVYHPGTASYDEYLKYRDRFKTKASDINNIIHHYSSVLKADKVPFIFSLQPMLHNKVNKKLSATEEAFRTKVNFYEEARFDQFMDMSEMAERDSLKNLFKEEMLCLNYCWSDFLSDEWEKIVTDNGGIYIDINKEAEKLDEHFELYTDFCHLTAQGNEFVAKTFADAIIKKGIFQ